MFLCLGQEIPASSAVELLRIECVEEPEQLNFVLCGLGLCWVVRTVQVSAGRIEVSEPSLGGRGLDRVSRVAQF